MSAGDHRTQSTTIEPLRGYSVNYLRAERASALLLVCVHMYRWLLCSLLLLDRIAAGLLTRSECGAGSESTPSKVGATGDRVGISMFFVTLVGHTLARPTRWSTCSFFMWRAPSFRRTFTWFLVRHYAAGFARVRRGIFLFLYCCKLLLFAITFFFISNT